MELIIIAGLAYFAYKLFFEEPKGNGRTEAERPSDPKPAVPEDGATGRDLDVTDIEFDEPDLCPQCGRIDPYGACDSGY